MQFLKIVLVSLSIGLENYNVSTLLNSSKKVFQVERNFTVTFLVHTCPNRSNGKKSFALNTREEDLIQFLLPRYLTILKIFT